MVNCLSWKPAMLDALEPLVSAVVIGCGATLVTDAWALAQRWLMGIASLDYAMVGLGSLVAPFFIIMQPAMGAGIAASRTPKPWAARIRSIITHFVFAIGPYLSALAWQALKSL
jgi:Protein of unknown function (DUF2938)